MEPILSDLRDVMIRKFNELLSDNRKNKKDIYTEFELEMRSQYADRLVDAMVKDDSLNSMDTQKKKATKSRARSQAYVVVAHFIDQMAQAVKRGGKVGDSMDEIVKEALKKFLEKDSSGIMEDNLFNRTVYYICGWLLVAASIEASRRKENSTYHHSPSQPIPHWGRS